MSYVLYTYLAYLALSLPTTIWVARTLHKNGRAFLIDAFHGQETLADSVNHLLVVGFYLINVGWITMTLRTQQALDTPRQAVELLSDKVGTVLFVARREFGSDRHERGCTWRRVFRPGHSGHRRV